MSTHRWIAIAAILLALPALLPQVGANGAAPECASVVTSQSANGIHPVVDLGDQIAVGLSTNVPTSAGAVLIIIPSLCDVPNPWDVVGEVQHQSGGSEFDPGLGNGTLP